MFKKKCRRCKELYESETFASRYCQKCKKKERLIKSKECWRCGKKYISRNDVSYYCDECKKIVAEIQQKEKASFATIQEKEKNYKFENRCLFCKRSYRTNNLTSNYCDQCKAKTVLKKCELCNFKYRDYAFKLPICKPCLIKRKKKGKMILEAIEINKLKARQSISFQN